MALVVVSRDAMNPESASISHNAYTVMVDHIGHRPANSHQTMFWESPSKDRMIERLIERSEFYQ